MHAGYIKGNYQKLPLATAKTSLAPKLSESGVSGLVLFIRGYVKRQMLLFPRVVDKESGTESGID